MGCDTDKRMPTTSTTVISTQLPLALDERIYPPYKIATLVDTVAELGVAPGQCTAAHRPAAPTICAAPRSRPRSASS